MLGFIWLILTVIGVLAASFILPDANDNVRALCVAAAAAVITLGSAGYLHHSQRRIRALVDDAIVQLPEAEHRLAGSAEAAIQTISQSSAWHSDRLRDHRARLDLEDELHQIVSTCGRLVRLQDTINAGRRSRREHDVVRRARSSLDDVRAMLQKRVASLEVTADTSTSSRTNRPSLSSSRESKALPTS